MSTAIRYADARCALGGTLDDCARALLDHRTPHVTQGFPGLDEPVEQPYFAMTPQEQVHSRDIFAQLRDMLERAIAHAGLSRAQLARTGLFMGSSSFDVRVSEVQYARALAEEGEDSALSMPIIGYGKLAGRLQRELGLSQQVYTYSTACTSSANAMLYGQRMLDAGLIDRALVLGFEFFNYTSLLGFQGLGLISPSAAMRPFDPRRDGLMLGEGCGLVLLENTTETPALSLAGGAIGTDNHSLTAANNDGSSVARVIRQALSAGGLEAADIRAIKLHGTASLMNDEAEAGGLHQVFGEQAPPAFAFKPYCGHTLGACGALEVALLSHCLERDCLPGNPGLEPDERLGVTLNTAEQTAAPGHYLLNCFAFGGNNNALILRKAH